jgi:5-methylcytosine-specific restriction endonuclease McrA
MRPHGWDSSTRKARLPKNWPQVRHFILARDGHLCRLHFLGCTVEATEVDHIQSGDNHHPMNLHAVCHPCHQLKTLTERELARPKTKRPPERHPGLT